MDDCVANFPEDIVKEILLRCPVKSLLRSKCVCKNWRALIKTPEFIQKHLKNGSPPTPKLLIYDNGEMRSDSCSITLQKFIGVNHLIGSVDGLFLMVGAIDREVSCALWNPATREVRPLHLPIPTAIIHDAPVFGFGLNPLTNDYKVVYFHYNHLSEYYAAVCSCSRDSWRIFKPEIPFFTDVNHTFGTAYLNGTYYWLLRSNYTILLFDFGNEMFEEIEGPDRHSVNTFVLGLMLINHSMAILNYIPCSMFEYDIWVMIQPGVWNKLVTFQCHPLIKSCYDSSLILGTRTSQLVT